MPAFDRPGSQQFMSWQDMARSPDESVYPEMWDTLDGYWLTELGQTGSKLINLGLAGARHDGTLAGTSLPAWQPMPEDGRWALDFRDQASDAHVDCGILIPDAALGQTQPRRNEITFGAYIALETIGGGDNRFISKAETSGDHDYMMGHTSGFNNLRTRLRVDSVVHTDITAAPAAPVGTHLYCCTFDGADIKHWRDGELLATYATAGSLTFRTGNNPLRLGSNKGSNMSMDAHGCMWFVAGRVWQPWEMYELSRDPAILVRPRPAMISRFVPGGALALNATITDDDTLSADATLRAALASTITDDDTLVADADLLNAIVATVPDDDALLADLIFSTLPLAAIIADNDSLSADLTTTSLQLAATITDIDNRRTVGMSAGSHKTKSSVFLG